MRAVILFRLFSACSFLLAGAVNAAPKPATRFWEANRLEAVRAAIKNDKADGEIREAAQRLRAEANAALKRKPASVLDKDGVPPSGDKHDYISYAVYWWPDPKQPDGTPYIRRDGYTNQEQRAKGDRDRLKRMIEDVESLALADYLLPGDDGKYGKQARRVLRTWFLEPETRMNPNLRYAQAVVGLNDGRGSGIIDTRAFIELLDAIVLLEQAGALNEADLTALNEWFADYYKWLKASEPGREERRAKNNHGTWYAAQTARIALHLGDEKTAKALITDARDHRLAAALDANGAQPEELERTRSLHYSLFNLAAFAYLARMGESLDIDLWRHKTPNGASMEKALLFAAPYVLDQKRWPHEQVHDYALTPQIVQLLRMAAGRYDQPQFRKVLERGPRAEPRREFAPLLFALPQK